MPDIVACGSRNVAYDRFRTAQAAGVNVMLLVDAEGPVTSAGPRQHLQASDGWDRPGGTTDGQCHMMVQVMEPRLLADADALESFYGQGFRPQSLPRSPAIEEVAKQDVLTRLAQATRNTRKGNYSKGKHGFAILEKLDLARVRKASGHADRLIWALSRQGAEEDC